MEYRTIQPCEELREIVSHFWVCTWDREDQAPHTQFYVIANSLTEITFAFSGPEKQDDFLFSLVQGHTVSPLQSQVPGYRHMIGVALYSYAIPSLFSLPSSDLSNELISLRTFLDQEGRMLNELIAMAGSTDERIEILSNFFRSLLKNSSRTDRNMIRAINAINGQRGNSRITAIAESSFLSEKQFKRRFNEFTGFNPKTYARIVRLESAIKSYPVFSSLTDLALESGYYDQAHFNREFKGLTGFSPRDFWKLAEL